MNVSPLAFLIPNYACLENINEHVAIAKDISTKLRECGMYRELESNILIYRITNRRRSYIGLVLGVDIQAFLHGEIVHHEKTIPAKVDKQAVIAQQNGGFSKPILLTHNPISVIEDIKNRYVKAPPLISVQLTKHNAVHEIWQIKDSTDITRIQEAYSKQEHLYIVDGHHRTGALRQLVTKAKMKLKFGMCALFDTSQLDILPFHRLVEIDGFLDVTEFLMSLSKFVSITEIDKVRKPGSTHEIIMMLKGRQFAFRWKNEVLDKNYGANKLDVNLLTKLVFNNLLGSGSSTSIRSITYLEGNKTITEIESLLSNARKLAFLLYPISMNDLVDITSNDQILPPKSTWFLPRLVNGLIAISTEE